LESKNNDQVIYERVREMGDEVRKILEILKNNKEGCYHKELLNQLECSDVKFRPILLSLYNSNLINKIERGSMTIYKINKNGEKLLSEILKEEQKNA